MRGAAGERVFQQRSTPQTARRREHAFPSGPASVPSAPPDPPRDHRPLAPGIAPATAPGRLPLPVRPPQEVTGVAPAAGLGAVTGASHMDAAVALMASALAGGKTARLTVSGSCMTPLIGNGDTVLFRAPSSVPPRGAVVIARDPNGHLVCHRFLGLAGDGHAWLATESSNCAERIPLESILGVGIEVERNERHLDLLAFPWRLADATLAHLHGIVRPVHPASSSGARPIRTAAVRSLRLISRLTGHVRWLLGGVTSAPQAIRARRGWGVVLTVPTRNRGGGS